MWASVTRAIETTPRAFAGATRFNQAARPGARTGRPFDIAVLDMHMPDMDGLELARAIRAQAALSATRLVMLSSTYSNTDVHSRTSSGVCRYLNKPIRRADLHRALLGVLADRQDDAPFCSFDEKDAQHRRRHARARRKQCNGFDQRFGQEVDPTNRGSVRDG